VDAKAPLKLPNFLNVPRHTVTELKNKSSDHGKAIAALQERIQQVKDELIKHQVPIPTDEFSTAVKVLKAQSVFKGEKNLIECGQCKNKYETKWELRQHMKICRRSQASFVHLKKGDEFGCDICTTKYKSRYEVKKHLFEEHTDIQC
jgi:hypothetical protein